MRSLSEHITWISINDHQLDLFEGQYSVPRGMAYNSYTIQDEKTAVCDTVAEAFTDEWLSALREVLHGESPDYLIVHHMEPDHSASITAFCEAYPEAVLVGSPKTFEFMKQFYGSDYADRRIIVKDGDTLSLGSRTLTFYSAPMVHWPEVMMSFDDKDGFFFSADAFGKFGANDTADPEGWACEARRYYFGIVGKYGPQVQAVFKKIGGLNIRTICPLHGPVLTEDIGQYLSCYQTWSTYEPEDAGVTIAFTSVYGHTKEAVERLASLLRDKNIQVSVHDLARMDMAEAVEDAFRYDRLVLATTTYNTEIFPFMKTFIDTLAGHGFRNRRIGIIENGTWAPMAAKHIRKGLEPCKDLVFTDTTVTIKSALDAASEEALRKLADELA